MGRNANMGKLARQQMLKILKKGRVTTQTVGAGESAQTQKTVRDPSTADLRLALEMAALADQQRDYDDADELRDGVKANQQRKAKKVLGIAGRLPPVGEGNDSAVRAG
jgi:hypothetical protein